MKQNKHKKYLNNLSLEDAYKDKITKYLERIKRIKDSLEIIRFLNAKNVDFVVFKGITLHHIRKDRFFYDLDIFVGKADVNHVISLLKNEFSYEPDSMEMHQFETGHGFHIALSKEDMIQIEIHYLLWDCSYVDEKKIPILSSKKYLTINKTEVPTLSDELQLIEVLCHNVYNHGFVADYDRWHNDIESIIENHEIDWGEFLKIIYRLDNQEMIYRTIDAIELFTNKKVGIPSEVKKKLFDSSIPIRMFLTSKFNKRFIKSYPKIKRYVLSSDRRWHNWRLKCALRFSFGLNKTFFRLLFYYIWSFRLLGNIFFPPKNIVQKRFATRSKPPMIYLYYIPYLFVAFMYVFNEYKRKHMNKTNQ